MSNTHPIRRLALTASLLFLAAFPAQASAQGYYGPFPPAEDYGPGITVSGAGWGPLDHRDRATARAVGDARRRAEAIAAALGVSIGEPRYIELITPFEPRPECVNRTTGRCAPMDAVSAVVTFAIAGGPTSDEDAREVEGTGTAASRIEVERQTSPAIRHAIRATRLEITPEAARTARANAESAGRAAGIQLGPLFSAVEPSTAAFGYDPLLGSFGPGQFCGTIRRVITRRDPDTGGFRIVGRKRVRRCYKPSPAVRLDVTYLGA
ncbi:MAG TPA: SIMPL domain-containing protein [Thermoleophilaceae bacterium]|nr:SIMPL domain-containing protein [Thermoleophilaceae bacterium]